MNPRERTIAVALLAGITLAAGAFLFYQLYLVPLQERETTIANTKAEINRLKERFAKVEARQKEFALWRKLSLPGDVNFSELEYPKQLNKMMEKSGFAQIVVRANNAPNVRTGPGSPLAKKDSLYTPLNFTVKGHGNLARLVSLLEAFYQTPLLHKIKHLSVKRPATPTPLAVKAGHPSPWKDDLEIELEVEAIILSDAEMRPQLVPAEKAHNLAREPNAYRELAAKDIFYGPPPPLQKPDTGPDPAQAIRLTCILQDSENGCMAVLYDEEAKSTCSLCPKTGEVRFQIKKLGQVQLDGEVLRIDIAEGTVFFRADDKLYAIRLEQTLAEALRKPLSAPQVKALELTRAGGNSGPD